MEFPEARILVFGKAPVAGRVKTRLAGHYGAEGAARIYRALLRDLLGRLCVARLAPLELWCAPDCGHPFFAACRRDYGVALRRQPAGDLGRRMHRALASTLADRDHGVLIGGDCASLDAGDLREALSALRAGADAVLGPATDGGYVLVGLARPAATMFRGVAWGGAGVLAATRERMRRAGLRWHELAPRWDVDRPADVRAWRRQSSPNASVV